MCSYSVLGIGTLAYSIVMIGVCLALYHSSFSIVSAVYQSFTSVSFCQIFVDLHLCIPAYLHLCVLVSL
jgi:hypothetical protein